MDAEPNSFSPSALVHFPRLPPSHQDHLNTSLEVTLLLCLSPSTAISQKIEQMGFPQALYQASSLLKTPVAPFHPGQKLKANVLAVVYQGLDDLAPLGPSVPFFLASLSQPVVTVPSRAQPSPVRGQDLPHVPSSFSWPSFVASLSLTWKYFHSICSL